MHQNGSFGFVHGVANDNNLRRKKKMFDDPNLTVSKIVLEYRDTSGSFDNLPKPGTMLKCEEFGRLRVIDAQPMSRHTDGGARPFTVRLTCLVGPQQKMLVKPDDTGK